MPLFSSFTSVTSFGRSISQKIITALSNISVNDPVLLFNEGTEAEKISQKNPSIDGLPYALNSQARFDWDQPYFVQVDDTAYCLFSWTDLNQRYSHITKITKNTWANVANLPYSDDLNNRYRSQTTSKAGFADQANNQLVFLSEKNVYVFYDLSTNGISLQFLDPNDDEFDTGIAPGSDLQLASNGFVYAAENSSGVKIYKGSASKNSITFSTNTTIPLIYSSPTSSVFAQNIRIFDIPWHNQLFVYYDARATSDNETRGHGILLDRDTLSVIEHKQINISQNPRSIGRSDNAHAIDVDNKILFLHEDIYSFDGSSFTVQYDVVPYNGGDGRYFHLKRGYFVIVQTGLDEIKSYEYKFENNIFTYNLIQTYTFGDKYIESAGSIVYQDEFYVPFIEVRNLRESFNPGFGYGYILTVLTSNISTSDTIGIAKTNASIGNSVEVYEPDEPITGLSNLIPRLTYYAQPNGSISSEQSLKSKKIGIAVSESTIDPSIQTPPWVTDLTTATYDNVSVELSTVDSDINQSCRIYFSPNGKRLYTVEKGYQGVVRRHFLTIPFDLSTISTGTVLAPNGSTNVFISNVEFSKTGDTYFRLIRTFNSGVAANRISTEASSNFLVQPPDTYDNQYAFDSNIMEDALSFRFNTDGTKIYFCVGNFSEANIYQWAMSTPFDLDTRTFEKTFSTSSQGNPKDFVFSPDGTKLYILIGSAIYSYSLSSAFDIGTTTYDGVSFDVSGELTPDGIQFNIDGSKMFVSGSSIHQYTVG